MSTHLFELASRTPSIPLASAQALRELVGRMVRFRSGQGGYLHRPADGSGVLVCDTGVGNVWFVEAAAESRIRLRSWRGDYLSYREDWSGPTCGTFSSGSEWTARFSDGVLRLQSVGNSYLCREDPQQVAASSEVGPDSAWTAEIFLAGNPIRLRSCKGDYLHRPGSSAGVSTAAAPGPGSEWTIEQAGEDKFLLRSNRGDYLHRPDSPQGVSSGPAGPGNEWIAEHITGNRIRLVSWKGDFLHRPNTALPAVTSCPTGSVRDVKDLLDLPRGAQTVAEEELGLAGRRSVGSTAAGNEWWVE